MLGQGSFFHANNWQILTNHENPKHQKTNSKQIPIIKFKIPNKQIPSQIFQ